MTKTKQYLFTALILCMGALGCPDEATEDTTSAQTQDGNTPTQLADAGQMLTSPENDAGTSSPTETTDAGQPPMAEPLTLAPGQNELTWQQMVNGSMATRTFIVNTPPDFDATQSYPVVFVFHGNAGGNPNATPHQGLVSATNEMVQDKEFIAVMPQGYDNCWQLGPENSNATTQDEMDFVAMMVSRLKATPAFIPIFFMPWAPQTAQRSHTTWR